LNDGDRGGRKRLPLILREKELLHYATSQKVTFITKIDSKENQFLGCKGSSLSWSHTGA